MESGSGGLDVEVAVAVCSGVEVSVAVAVGCGVDVDVAAGSGVADGAVVLDIAAAVGAATMEDVVTG
jgi:hypothetical protein